MGLAEKMVPSIAFAVAFGAVMFVLGGVATPIFEAVTPASLGVVGFAAALAIGLSTK